MKKTKLDYRAKLTIHEADKLTVREAVKMGDWLRKLADDILGNQGTPGFAKRFTARYMR